MMTFNFVIASTLVLLSAVNGSAKDNIFKQRNRQRRHKAQIEEELAVATISKLSCVPPPPGKRCRRDRQCLCPDWICEGKGRNKVCVKPRTDNQIIGLGTCSPPRWCIRDKDCVCPGLTCERVGRRKICVDPAPSPTMSPTPSPTPRPTSSNLLEFVAGTDPTSIPTSTIFCPEQAGTTSTVSAGALSIAVVNSNVQPRLCTLTKRNIVSKAILPIARSYDGHIWEQAAGPFAAKTFAVEKIECTHYNVENVMACQMQLPPLSSNEQYVLSTYEHSISKRNEIARFLEQMTFGITSEGIAALEATDADFELWMKDQMALPATSHRAYWRRRTNPKWTTPQEPGCSDHPCSPYSRWRKYAFTRIDRLDVYAGKYRSIQVTYLKNPSYFTRPFQSENATYDQSTAFLETKRSGYSGKGYIALYGSEPTAYIEWEFESPIDDTYTLGIRYALDTEKPNTVNIIVNGNTVAYSLQLPSTSSWSNWEFYVLENIALHSGGNVVRIECNSGSTGPNIDYMKIFSPSILSIDGHVRTVVPALILKDDKKNAEYIFDEKHHYEICKWPRAPQRGYPNGSLHLRLPLGDCEEVDRNLVGNPRINFNGYDGFVPHVFEFNMIETNSFVSSINNLDYNIVELDQEFLLPGGLNINTHSMCGKIPKMAYQLDAPVFAKLADGTWVQWDPQLNLEQNTNDSPVTDGGGETTILTGDKTKCMNVPRNFWNEDKCVLSKDESACSLSVPAPATSILLDYDNITRFYDLTKGSKSGSTRYVYAIRGLVAEDSPCKLKKSRWEISTNTNCMKPSNLRESTVKTFTKLLMDSGNNPFIRDIEVGDESCNTEGFDPAEIEVQINRDCFKHVHPAHLSVYDMTYWTEKKTHQGNMYAEMKGHQHPIKKWAKNDDYPGWYLIYPASHPTDPSFDHPMSRFDTYNSKFDYVGRLGDSVQFRDLPSALKTADIAAYYGVPLDTSGPGLLVCGSFDEVPSDPSLGSIFDLETPNGSTSSGSDLEQQRDVVWSTIAISGDDQLCQRMAWALAQILVVVPDGIRHHEMTEPFLGYYDIMVRNCFGNYRDILREIVYNPLMAEHLSYLNSKSHAYIYETRNRQETFADENFAREIMQLFTIGLKRLNQDGTPQLDSKGNEVEVYSSEDIMAFARAWTGFRGYQDRGNIESEANSCSNCNRQDPMFIEKDYRDRFPKSDLLGGYIGDRYPLCVDLPNQMFLRKGAKYRFLGSSPLPELMEDNKNFANDPTIKRMVLDSSSTLYQTLFNGGAYLNTVVLATNHDCYLDECDVDTVRVVEIEGLSVSTSASSSGSVYYEYVRPACVEQAFYEGGKKVIKRNTKNSQNTCANPLLPYAMEACCPKDATGSKIKATRNYIYDGERMTFDRATTSCAAIGRKLCDFSKIDKKISPGFKTGYHWTTAHCSVEVKINQDGYVAMVYNIENRRGSQALHVSEESLNYFKAYWENGKYPITSNNCSSPAECTALAGDGCQCKIAVSEGAVFSSKPSSADEILAALVIGAMNPEAFDDGTFIRQEESDFTAYLMNGVYDSETIFEVTNEMSQTFFLKNVHSTVKIVGGSFNFRNAPHFMSMLSGSEPYSIGETTRRDAEYETEAVLDHYFYHPNVGPFLCVRFIQRFGISNPSPRYVETCAKSFRDGTYTAGSHSYGSKKYGDLAALIASIALDREARSSVLDADPSSGSLREPILKVTGLLRALHFEREDGLQLAQLHGVNKKIGQMAYSFESVFSFFLPEKIPNDGPLAAALLTSPESSKLEMPFILGTLDGIFSLVKYGLSDCNGGFGVDPGSGKCRDNGFYERSQGALNFGPTTVFSRVLTSSDDAEERENSGYVSLSSSDLELGRDKSSQWVGMRFTNVHIPKGAQIVGSYIELEADEKDDETTSLTIYGQAADNPSTFSSENHNISDRRFTGAVVSWNDVPGWQKKSEKHHTPDLSPIIQELVNRSGWSSGNSIVVIINGKGKRVAEAWDGEPDNAPLLAVTYSTDGDSTPTGRSPAEIIDNLATLLTAGRLSTESKGKIKNVVKNTGGDIQAGVRLAEQLIAATPEFHATSLSIQSGEKRQKQSIPFSSTDDYKALVYIFLSGGMDSFNMLAPHTCPHTTDLATNTYDQYMAIREQVALRSGITLEIDSSTSSQPCTSFGIHPGLPILRDMYNEGSAFFVANTGLLAKLVNKTNYKEQTPTQLFAHNTMRRETKQLDLNEECPGSGVVGRLSDMLVKIGYSTNSFSISGDKIALMGKLGVNPSPAVMSSSGLTAFNAEPSISGMDDLIKDLNSATHEDSGFMSETWASGLSIAMDQHSILYNALEQVTTNTTFPDTELGRQLSTVSRLMKTHTNRGTNRDMFYVSISGFDTHSNVGPRLFEMFHEVNSALGAFVNEMKSQGRWESITMVQSSEFARTLSPNSGDGTDHGWGQNIFVLGGSLNGKRILGHYPSDFSEKSPFVLERGKMIPTTPVDSIWNGISQWYGVTKKEDLDEVLPMRKNFPAGIIYNMTDLYRMGTNERPLLSGRPEEIKRD